MSALHAKIDPEALPGLQALLAAFGPKGFNGIADINERRKALGAITAAGPKADPAKVSVVSLKVPGLLPDDPQVEIRIISPLSLKGTVAPGIFYIHGGGMVLGTAEEADGGAAALAEAVGGVVCNVEYRLAPEHPDPALINDCYAGLKYFSAHASEFGVDNNRIAVYGPSAGGGLAAGTALKARDEKLEPALAFECLIYPMLDDRNVSKSSEQIVDIGIWDRSGNIEAWNWYLARDPSIDPVSAKVSIYAAPARCTDLSGLPPTYIDVGDLDAFRDEDVEYGLRLMQAGVPVEMHVFPGCFHAWEIFAPTSKSGSTAIKNRIEALKRALKV